MAGKGECVKATSPPLCKGSFHWRLNALPHTPETSLPDKFPFRRLPLHCVAGVSYTLRAMPTQRPTHIDSTPTPDPDVRTAEALTPFPLSVNLSNYSEQPTEHGTEGWTLSQCKPNNKVLSLHKLHDTPLCSLLRVLSAPFTLHLHYAQPRHYRTSPTFILFARFEKSSQRESGAVAQVKIHEWIFDLHDSDFTAQSVGRSAYSARVQGSESETLGRAVGGTHRHLGGKPPNPRTPSFFGR